MPATVFDSSPRRARLLRAGLRVAWMAAFALAVGLGLRVAAAQTDPRATVAPAATSAPAALTTPATARVLFTSGGVRTQVDGQVVPAARGDALASGTTLMTAPDGRAQLRLADGTQIALQGDSTLVLATSPSHLQLLAGSARVLGARRDSVEWTLRLQRGSAQVRGPAFSVGYNADGTANIATERDPITVCTAAGCETLSDDGALRVRGDTARPARTNARATFR
jgi:ferric-dicitrate binding protein FerR (iron transport regulator)